MNNKLQTGIYFLIFFFCSRVIAEQLLLGPIYTDAENEVSFIITFPQGTDRIPEAKNFKILENAKILSSADTIERLDQSNKGLALLFCIDVSGSIKQKVLMEIQDALINLLTTSRIEDKYGLISFADDVITESEFTNKRDTLINSIRSLKTRGKHTVLYQAVFDSLNKLHHLMPNKYQRIVVISDGKDDKSIETLESLISLSKNYGIPIDAIGRGSIDEQYSDGLRGLANATGGRFIHAQPDSISLRDAIIRIHKKLVESTWVVRFQYQANPENLKVENAVLKYEQNHTINFSTTIAQSIPRPISIHKDDIDEKWKNQKQMILLFGLLLLLLTTLFFILWLLKRCKHKNSDNDPGKVQITPSFDEQTSPPLFTIPPVRQTVVGYVSSSNTSQPLPNITLQGITGPLEGQSILIDQQPFLIGANQDNNLVLDDDEFVSGTHVSFSYSNNKLLISDQSSLNGTLLNGEKIIDQTVQVFPKDEISIGNSSFRVMEF